MRASLALLARSYKPPPSYAHFLSPTARARQPSPIRSLMPLMAEEGMISLGGGLPNPSTFPLHSLSFGVGNETITLTEQETAAALQVRARAAHPSAKPLGAARRVKLVGSSALHNKLPTLSPITYGALDEA